MTSLQPTEHPTRQALLDAVSSKNPQVLEHMKNCEDCRALFELLEAYQVAGELPLPDAPLSWVQKAEKLADMRTIRSEVTRLTAALSFDSWALATAAGVRSAGTTSERRLRFQAEALSFDLRIEQNGRQWNCVGRLTGDRIDTSLFCVESNKLNIEPNEDGFYQWLSTVPPRKLRLSSPETVIDLPEIVWRTRSQS
jgi:hypothetical protein